MIVLPIHEIGDGRRDVQWEGTVTLDGKRVEYQLSYESMLFRNSPEDEWYERKIIDKVIVGGSVWIYLETVKKEKKKRTKE